ncbi:hypothetical protein CUC08_Gglean012469 [Alternaria sp. MG1]|nr:hypothetical protein CUC08_Gglean012469 [Alternaria sp. MG1]
MVLNCSMAHHLCAIMQVLPRENKTKISLSVMIVQVIGLHVRQRDDSPSPGLMPWEAWCNRVQKAGHALDVLMRRRTTEVLRRECKTQVHKSANRASYDIFA